MERYTAFTSHGLTRRFFRIWHLPWPQVPVEIFISDDLLLKKTWPWFDGARLVGANYSLALMKFGWGGPIAFHDKCSHQRVGKDPAMCWVRLRARCRI